MMILSSVPSSGAKVFKGSVQFSAQLLLLLGTLLLSMWASAQPYSLVINHGRVIDPESGLDAIAHIGIQEGKIVAISQQPLQGQQVIDAGGLVVSPGFIDLHTHSPTPLGQYYQMFDGVTTALELEAGAYPVTDYGVQIKEQPLLNYGASAGYVSMRILQKQGIEVAHTTAKPMPVNLAGVITGIKSLFMPLEEALNDTFHETADEADLAALRELINQGLDDGAFGIGLALDYISEAVNEKEINMIFDAAAQRGAPLFIHIRRGINGDPSGLREVLALAKKHSASLHICHISHNAMGNLKLFLSEISQARAEGVDVTTEVLPHNAGSTLISAAVFSRDWQTIFNISYGDVEWAPTGERFTEESWFRIRAEHPKSGVIHHYLKEEWTQLAVQSPGVIIVSDLLPMETKDKKVAPNNGTFSRILGKYVREQGLLDLPTALAKMTLLPAQRLENYAAQFKNKGRIKVGSDADITIFNADTIIDKATYQSPYQEGVGFSHVIVNGVQVMKDGALVPEVYPGKQLLKK